MDAEALLRRIAAAIDGDVVGGGGLGGGGLGGGGLGGGGLGGGDLGGIDVGGDGFGPDGVGGGGFGGGAFGRDDVDGSGVGGDRPADSAGLHGSTDADGAGGSGDGEPRLVHLRVLPARPAAPAPLPADLPDLLFDRLRRVGVEQLYRHQAEALTRILSGGHTVVATGTASGKSLCYQLPILAQALTDDSATTLYLSPTKALARDQLRQLRRFGLPHVRPAAYDGDTPRGERDAVRRTANVVLTNPDMLHLGILPGHRRWADFLGRLRLVVVDECHTARGVFGSHVAAVLRRLQRVTDHYGARPTFVLTSATIGNPAAHASALTGLAVEAVTDDGAPAPRRAVALWSPPQIMTSSDGGRAPRRSTLAEAADLMAALVAAGAATLTFVGSRKGAESVAAATRRRLGPAGDDRISVYRAGLLDSERRSVEQGLADGRIRGVAATDALELGIDVSGLDAVVIAGWPGTIASLWQQAGRAGRRDRDATVVFVAADDPLDQYLLLHPREIFDRSVEHAVIDVTNPAITAAHLQCAAAELPLRDVEPRLAPVDVAAALAREVTEGRLRERGGRWYPTVRGAPAASVNLRTASGAPVEIVDDAGQLIGVVDHPRAAETVHSGAVYLHQGRPWSVRELDLDAGRAVVEPDDGATRTSPRVRTELRVLDRRDQQAWGPVGLFYGAVEVSRQVLAFERRHLFSGVSYGLTPLDLPAQELTTTALWLTLPQEVTAAIAARAVPGAVHAAEHAAIGLLPLFAMCDRWDIGGVSTAHHPDTGATSIFIYDGHPGGAGIARRGFDAGRRLWEATLDAVAGCGCASGCPSCVQSPKCGNGNHPLDKAGAVTVLRAALARR